MNTIIKQLRILRTVFFLVSTLVMSQSNAQTQQVTVDGVMYELDSISATITGRDPEYTDSIYLKPTVMYEGKEFPITGEAVREPIHEPI